MDCAQINMLREMLNPEDEEDDVQNLVNNPNAGSALNPGDVGDKKKKDQAKPFAKIDIKQGSKPDPNLPQNVEQKEEPKPKKNTKNQIWDEEEVKELPIFTNDERERPETEELFKQTVGANDVFGGWSNLDPSSTKCQEMLFKIFLPETKHKEISLDINKYGCVIQTPKYYLYHQFCHQVNEKQGKCRWVADKYYLELTLPMVRESLIPDL